MDQQQMQAVNSVAKRVFVVAGAGTGKTTVLTERIMKLCRDRIFSPEEILCLSHTKKGAAVMIDRFNAFSADTSSTITCSTIHSVCCKVMKVGTDWQLVEDIEYNQLIRHTIWQNKQALLPGVVAVDSYVQDLMNATKYGKKFRTDSVLGRLQLEVDEEMVAYKFVTYESVVWRTVDLLMDAATVMLPEPLNQLKYVAVDEAQDLCASQSKLLIVLMAKFKICTMIAGDVRQSIFESMNNSFKSNTRKKYNHYGDEDDVGGEDDDDDDENSMSKLVTANRKVNHCVIYLAMNYRCTALTQLAAEHALSSASTNEEFALQTTTKTYNKRKGIKPILMEPFPNRVQQFDFIGKEILSMVSSDPHIQYKNIAILVRLNNSKVAISSMLNKLKIPHVVVGVPDWVKAKACVSIMDVLKLAERWQPFVMRHLYSMFAVKKSSVNQTEPNGGGSEFIDQLISRWPRTDDINTVLQSDFMIFANTDPLSKRLFNIIQTIIAEREVATTTTDQNQPNQQPDLCSSIMLIANSLSYDRPKEFLEVAEGCVSVQDLVERLNKIRTACKLYEEENEEAPAEEDEEELVPNAVTLSNIHMAKGGEWDIVFMPETSDYHYPRNTMDIAEEARLMFVAMTRAKRLLILTYSVHDNMKLSRFIQKNLFQRISPNNNNNNNSNSQLLVMSLLAASGGGETEPANDTLGVQHSVFVQVRTDIGRRFEYCINAGAKIQIGRAKSNHISMNSLNVSRVAHLTIECNADEAGSITVTPKRGSMTWFNGQLATDPITLSRDGSNAVRIGHPNRNASCDNFGLTIRFHQESMFDQQAIQPEAVRRLATKHSHSSSSSVDNITAAVQQQIPTKRRKLVNVSLYTDGAEEEEEAEDEEFCPTLTSTGRFVPHAPSLHLRSQLQQQQQQFSSNTTPYKSSINVDSSPVNYAESNESVVRRMVDTQRQHDVDLAISRNNNNSNHCDVDYDDDDECEDEYDGVESRSSQYKRMENTVFTQMLATQRLIDNNVAVVSSSSSSSLMPPPPPPPPSRLTPREELLTKFALAMAPYSSSSDKVLLESNVKRTLAEIKTKIATRVPLSAVMNKYDLAALELGRHTSLSTIDTTLFNAYKSSNATISFKVHGFLINEETFDGLVNVNKHSNRYARWPHDGIQCPIDPVACCQQLHSIMSVNGHVTNKHQSVVNEHTFNRCPDMFLAWVTHLGNIYYSWNTHCTCCRYTPKHNLHGHNDFVQRWTCDQIAVVGETLKQYVPLDVFLDQYLKYPNYVDELVKHVKEIGRAALLKNVRFGPFAYDELQRHPKLYLIVEVQVECSYSGRTEDTMRSRLCGHFVNGAQELSDLIQCGVVGTNFVITALYMSTDAADNMADLEEINNAFYRRITKTVNPNCHNINKVLADI